MKKIFLTPSDFEEINRTMKNLVVSAKELRKALKKIEAASKRCDYRIE